jgi:hypothetical protein
VLPWPDRPAAQPPKVKEDAMTRRRLVVLAVVTLCLGLAACFPDDSPRISIEFGALESAEGSDVVIDGVVVGKLEKTGQATRTSFPVKKGDHEITIKSASFDCETAKVRLELPSQKLRLLLDVSDVTSIGGKPTMILRGM